MLNQRGFSVVLTAWLVWSLPTQITADQSGGLACTRCLLDYDGTPLNRPLRVMYMDKPFTTTNPAAINASKRLGIPYSCDDPKLAQPECFRWQNWNSGWMGALFTNEIANNLGYDIEALTPANYSAASGLLYSGISPYTRCVYEVKARTVDICVGDFWVTDDRSRVISFTADIAIDFLMLFAKRQEAEELSTVFFTNIFRPFDPMVWVSMVALFVVASVLIWLVESRPRGTSPEAMFQSHKSFFPRTDGLIKTLWATFHAYFSQGDIGSYFFVTAWPGRLVVMGLSFFIYIICASYTANLAIFLTRIASATSGVSSISDIRSLGAKVCVLASLAAAFQNNPLFPLQAPQPIHAPHPV